MAQFKSSGCLLCGHTLQERREPDKDPMSPFSHPTGDYECECCGLVYALKPEDTYVDPEPGSVLYALQKFAKAFE